jgi:micrococcal nuclease
MLEPNYTYRAKITEVHDGDTCKAEIDAGFRITFTDQLRLARVNAPELTALDPAVKAKAVAARDFLAGLVLGKEVIVVTRKTEKYGRYLAEVYYAEGTAQKNASDALLASGNAVAYKG